MFVLSILGYRWPKVEMSKLYLGRFAKKETVFGSSFVSIIFLREDIHLLNHKSKITHNDSYLTH